MPAMTNKERLEHKKPILTPERRQDGAPAEAEGSSLAVS
jgi:hypothetical protein